MFSEQTVWKFVNSVQDISDSRRRTLDKAFDDMRCMKDALSIDDYSDEVVDTARFFYESVSSSPIASGSQKPENIVVSEGATNQAAIDEGDNDKLPGVDGSDDESDNFSDIDGFEERQQKRAVEAKNVAPAQTAAEATRFMLPKKRLSSKINYDALEKLFHDPAFGFPKQTSRSCL
ncbi:hypothetical protein REPUB_Repub06bG0071500 [Reevesia pubescens]